MKMNEYLNIAKIFPLMGEPRLADIAEQLDIILKTQYGLRSCGYLITCCVTEEGTISELSQTNIAKSVYLINHDKWKRLFDFADAEIKSWIDSTSTTTTEYGHIVDNKKGGIDSYDKTNKIAGFESTDFVDDNSEKHSTTYGQTGNTKHSGKNTITNEKMSKQAERLVDYTLKFWENNGIIKTIIKDTLAILTLPMYEMED